MPTLTIDGTTVHAAEGATILEAARQIGIDVPTLCHHEALEPWGACRLCVVDVTRASWDGWCKMVVSCMAAAEDGLIVDTHSERVQLVRQVAVDLLLARCPGNAAIQQLAARHGLEQTSYRARAEATDCILCGMCTRVCDTYATQAITTHGRGTARVVGTFVGEPPEDCVGCGGCALVCPTGHITSERTATGYEIWDRTFTTQVATVAQEHCLGCGSCEEACPFEVARVVLRAGGERVATVPAEHCRGCGACVGACPSGAIQQAGCGLKELVELASVRSDEPRHVVMACTRSGLRAGKLEPRGRLVEVPCTGRASVPLVLASAAQGAAGMLVLGRHQATCRLDGAEDRARDVVGRAGELLRMVGWPGRVQFAEPEPGPTGPGDAAAAFAADLAQDAIPKLPSAPPAELLAAAATGFDGSLRLLEWLCAQPGLRPDGASWLQRHDLPAALPGGAAVVGGVVPYLDLLAANLVAPVVLADVLRMALDVLARLGIGDAGVLPSACGALGEVDLSELGDIFAFGAAGKLAVQDAGRPCVAIDELVVFKAGQLARPAGDEALVATDGSATAGTLVEALGYQVLDVGPDPLPERFRFGPAERLAAEQRLARAERAGARALLVPDVMTLARWALVTREGSWRASRLLPLMPHQLAWHAAFEPALEQRFLSGALPRPPEPGPVVSAAERITGRAAEVAS